MLEQKVISLSGQQLPKIRHKWTSMDNYMKFSFALPLCPFHPPPPPPKKKNKQKKNQYISFHDLIFWIIEGCSGIQVEEIYSLDEASLDDLR